MKCPECRSSLVVLQTRQKDDCVFRRRKCSKCSFRTTTKETAINQKLPGDGTNDDPLFEPMHALCNRLGISPNGPIGALLAASRMSD